MKRLLETTTPSCLLLLLLLVLGSNSVMAQDKNIVSMISMKTDTVRINETDYQIDGDTLVLLGNLETPLSRLPIGSEVEFRTEGRSKLLTEISIVGPKELIDALHQN